MTCCCSAWAERGWLRAQQGVVPLDIVLLPRRGRHVGEAMVVLTEPVQLEIVMTRNQQTMGRNAVSITQATKLVSRHAYAPASTHHTSASCAWLTLCAPQNQHARRQRSHDCASEQPSPSSALAVLTPILCELVWACEKSCTLPQRSLLSCPSVSQI